MQALRIGDLVGVRYDIQTATDDFELYDLIQDPKQRHNLATDPQYAGWQQKLKDTVLRVRRPDPSAARPYDAAPLPAVATRSTEPGLRWQRFPGAFPWVPRLPEHLADARGVTSQVGPEVAGPTSAPSVTAFDGFLAVPVEGDYLFTLRADAGAVLRLHDATLFDCDQGYKAGVAKTAEARLQAGLHPIRITHRSDGIAPCSSCGGAGPGFQCSPCHRQPFAIDRPSER